MFIEKFLIFKAGTPSGGPSSSPPAQPQPGITSEPDKSDFDSLTQYTGSTKIPFDRAAADSYVVSKAMFERIFVTDIIDFQFPDEFIKAVKFFVASVSYVQGWKFKLTDINDITQLDYEKWGDYFCLKFYRISIYELQKKLKSKTLKEGEYPIVSDQDLCLDARKEAKTYVSFNDPKGKYKTFFNKVMGMTNEAFQDSDFQDKLLKILMQVTNPNFANTVALEVFNETMTLEDFKNILRKHYPHLKETKDIELATEIGGIDMKSMEVYKFSRSKILDSYRLYDLIMLTDVKNSLLYQDPITMSVWFYELIERFYKGSPFGELLSETRTKMGRNPDDQGAKRLLEQILLRLRREFTIIAKAKKAPVFLQPIILLNRYAHNLRNLPTSGLMSANFAAYGTSKLVLRSSETASKIAGGMLGVMMLPSLFSDKFAMDVMAGAASASDYFKSFPEKLKKVLQLKGTSKEIESQFKLIPFILRNIMLDEDFSNKTLQDLESYLHGGDSKFLRGDSMMLKHLREAGPNDPYVKMLKSLLERLYKRMTDICASSIKDGQKDKILLSNLVLNWLGTEPTLKGLNDIDLDITRTISENPQFEPKVPESLDEEQRQYVAFLRNSSLISREVKTALSERQLYANYHSKMDIRHHALVSISSVYGQLFKDSQNVISTEPLNFGSLVSTEDALGNQFMDLQFSGEFEDAQLQEIISNIQTNITQTNYVTRLVYVTQIGERDWHFGVILEKNLNTASDASVGTIGADPIEGSAVPHAFIHSEKLKSYTPEARILERLTGTDGKSFQPFESTEDILYKEVQKFAKGASAYADHLKAFYRSYKETSKAMANERWHDFIMAAMVKFIESDDSRVGDKAARLQELTNGNLSGFALYWKLLQLSVGTSTSKAKEQEERAYFKVVELDRVLEKFAKDKKLKPEQIRLLKSQTQYLRLLLGFAYANYTNKNTLALSRQIFNSIHRSILHYSEVDGRQTLDQSIRIYFEHRLEELTSRVSKSLDDKMDATKETPINEIEEYGHARYRHIKGGTVDRKILRGLRYHEDGTQIKAGKSDNVPKNTLLWWTEDVAPDAEYKGKIELLRSWGYDLHHNGGDGVKNLINYEKEGDHYYYIERGQRAFLPLNLKTEKPVKVKFMYGHDRTQDWYTRARDENFILVFADKYDGSLIDKIKAKIGFMTPRTNPVDVTYEHIAKDSTTKTKLKLPRGVDAKTSDDTDNY